jgi:hypothetical protein
MKECVGNTGGKILTEENLRTLRKTHPSARYHLTTITFMHKNLDYSAHCVIVTFKYQPLLVILLFHNVFQQDFE